MWKPGFPRGLSLRIRSPSSDLGDLCVVHPTELAGAQVLDMNRRIVWVLRAYPKVAISIAPQPRSAFSLQQLLQVQLFVDLCLATFVLELWCGPNGCGLRWFTVRPNERIKRRGENNGLMIQNKLFLDQKDRKHPETPRTELT